MRYRHLLTGALATVVPFTAAPPGAGAQSTEPHPDDANATIEVADEENVEQHCVVTARKTPQGMVADDSTMVCYDTLEAAVRQRSQTRSLITVATHFESPNGYGDTYTIQSSSCATTWIPGAWWSSNVSATRLGMSCAGAKHYTLSTCAGSYQVVNASNPEIVNLNATLNNNTGCVKYS